jgi:hypothetical protein
MMKHISLFVTGFRGKAVKVTKRAFAGARSG